MFFHRQSFIQKPDAKWLFLLTNVTWQKKLQARSISPLSLAFTKLQLSSLVRILEFHPKRLTRIVLIRVSIRISTLLILSLHFSITITFTGCLTLKRAFWIHTIYRKNNNLEKCAGMGLNGFHIKWISGTHCNWKNQYPGSPLGATS